ncbi:MAG: MobV family relaxase [Clostridiales bacterium]|nr:MobV family relaxase [Clostridiales bacterium]
MNYCIMHINKIKTFGTLTSKYKHNYRIADVKNADKELESHNEETFKLPNGKTYTDVCKARIAEIEKSTGRKIRKDAVLALEIITTFSRSALIDVDEWKKVNEKWLKETFNKAPDGKSNVISMVYHADEAGNIHCHSLIIPINNTGHLSSTSFMNGSKTMRELQDSYAHAMETVGLERGQKGSIAKHKKIRHMYAELNKALDDIPELKEGESAASYKERLLEDIQNIRDSNSLEYNERIQEAAKRITQEYNAQLEMYQKKLKVIELLLMQKLKN